MLTKEQIEERRNYIGGSDCAAVLGLSRWRTPLQVWSEKTGALPPEDLSDNLAVEVGNELEDLIAKLWMKRTGKKLYRVNETLVHPNHSFIRCNIDRRVVGEDTIWEGKTANGWKAKEWEKDAVPQEYVLQCMHNLAVTGKEKCEIAVLIGGNQDFIYKTIHRDTDMIRQIIQKERDFWIKFVEPKIFPQVITAHDTDTLYKLFPEGSDPNEIILGEEADRILDNLKALEQDRANIIDIIEKEKNLLRAMLKNHTCARTNRWRFSWKNQHKEAYQVPAADSRVLRKSEIKVKEAVA